MGRIKKTIGWFGLENKLLNVKIMSDFCLDWSVETYQSELQDDYMAKFNIPQFEEHKCFQFGLKIKHKLNQKL